MMTKNNFNKYKQSQNHFEDHGFMYVENFITEEERNNALLEIDDLFRSGQGVNDGMCENSVSFYGCLSGLHVNKTKLAQKLTGLNLIPSYCYSRVYFNTEKLPIHIDRLASEIVFSCTLYYNGDTIWPLKIFNRKYSNENLAYYYMEGNNNKFSPHIDYEKSISITINVNDAICYRGTEIIHWRDEYQEGFQQIQAFFSYVDADGPYRDFTN